jgi:hypothetical protein
MTDQPSTWDYVRRLLAMDREPCPPHFFDALPWPGVLHLARSQGIAPLLYSILQHHQAPLPAAVRDAFEESYYRVAAANTLRFQELAGVLAALSAAAVPVLLLKGAALAESVYGNLALRPMVDLDLMVPRDRIEQVPSLLEPLGYRLLPGPAGHPFPFTTRYGGEIMLRNDRSLWPVQLDVHWNLLAIWWMDHTTRLDVDALWQNARPLLLSGASVLQFCPEDALLHLCLHAGAGHSYAQLLNFIDIDRLVAVYQQLDWDQFVQRARRFQIGASVYFALQFTRDLLHTPIPPRVMADLGPSTLRRSVVVALASPQHTILGTRAPLSRRSRYLLHLALVDRPSGIARLARHLFLPDSDWLVARYSLTRPAQVRVARLLQPFRALGMAFAALGQFIRQRAPRRPTSPRPQSERGQG